MAREIEDKFLAIDDSWQAEPHTTTHIKQTYLVMRKSITVRTRLESGRPAIFCIKLAERRDGTPEYEWRMPMWLAKLCGRWSSRTIEKERNRIAWGELTIEVDVFLGKLLGLVMAEVEKPSVDTTYEKPKWFGKDVSKDSRYKNAMLLKHGIPS